MLRITQESWPAGLPPVQVPPQGPDKGVDWVLAFGSRAVLGRPECHALLQERFPNAAILMGSTAGEIAGTTVLDESISLTAVEFEHTQVRSAAVRLSQQIDRHAAGVEIAELLKGPDLALVFVLSDGQNVNGSELVKGLNSVLGGNVPVVGGLAGDGGDFAVTLVGLNAPPEPGIVAAVGLYGKDLEVNFGSEGGWEPFGPERSVTRSEGNVLHELDGRSALALYKSYLGPKAAELPSSGLLFPLSIRVDGKGEPAVRTLLSIDEADGSITFAGDVPVGAKVQLMRASYDRLVEGAYDAAMSSRHASGNAPQLAILISCVGRRAVLNQRVEEEVEEVAEVLKGAAICGFYSYGELSPTSDEGFCELHNQTMTITTLSER